jgi:hypothetical protein
MLAAFEDDAERVWSAHQRRYLNQIKDPRRSVINDANQIFSLLRESVTPHPLVGSCRGVTMKTRNNLNARTQACRTADGICVTTPAALLAVASLPAVRTQDKPAVSACCARAPPTLG